MPLRFIKNKLSQVIKLFKKDKTSNNTETSNGIYTVLAVVNDPNIIVITNSKGQSIEVNIGESVNIKGWNNTDPSRPISRPCQLDYPVVNFKEKLRDSSPTIYGRQGWSSFKEIYQ